jgi:hypothetical protein
MNIPTKPIVFAPVKFRGLQIKPDGTFYALYNVVGECAGLNIGSTVPRESLSKLGMLPPQEEFGKEFIARLAALENEQN